MSNEVLKRRLLTDRESAARVGKSKSGWRKDYLAGRTPLPVRLGRSVRWDAEELDAWISAGCPCRERWEALKEVSHG